MPVALSSSRTALEGDHGVDLWGSPTGLSLEISKLCWAKLMKLAWKFGWRPGPEFPTDSFGPAATALWSDKSVHAVISEQDAAAIAEALKLAVASLEAAIADQQQFASPLERCGVTLTSDSPIAAVFASPSASMRVAAVRAFAEFCRSGQFTVCSWTLGPWVFEPSRDNLAPALGPNDDRESSRRRCPDSEWLGPLGSIGNVYAVNGSGAHEIPEFVPVPEELIELGRFWAHVRLEIEWRWFEYVQICSSETRLRSFASRRIGRLANTIGDVAIAVERAEAEFSEKLPPELWSMFLRGEKPPRTKEGFIDLDRIMEEPPIDTPE